MYKGSISINAGDGAKGIVSLLNKDIEYRRSRAKVLCKNGSISIDIEADDPVALVSSMGSMLKQIRVITEVKDLVKRRRKAK